MRREEVALTLRRAADRIDQTDDDFLVVLEEEILTLAKRMFDEVGLPLEEKKKLASRGAREAIEALVPTPGVKA